MEGRLQGGSERRIPDRNRRRVRAPREQGGGEEELRGISLRPPRSARQPFEGKGEARAARNLSRRHARVAWTGIDASDCGNRSPVPEGREGRADASAPGLRGPSGIRAVRKRQSGAPTVATARGDCGAGEGARKGRVSFTAAAIAAS